MSREVYQTRAAPLDDDYTGDLQERPTRQRPTLTRRQAYRAWQEEKSFYFFQSLMITSTSYRSDWIDDLMSPDGGRRRFEAWQQQVERDRLHREQALERIQREITKRRTETACQHDRQKGERNNDD